METKYMAERKKEMQEAVVELAALRVQAVSPQALRLLAIDVRCRYDAREMLHRRLGDISCLSRQFVPWCG